MSTPRPNQDGTAPLEELTEPEKPLTHEQADRVRGGAMIKGDSADVCKIPSPPSPLPIPYPN